MNLILFPYKEIVLGDSVLYFEFVKALLLSNTSHGLSQTFHNLTNSQH